MTHTIFFSWQSDSPSKVGRNLIGQALERAVESLGQDAKIEEAVRERPATDRNARNASRSPLIVESIIENIDRATVFVADLTFTGHRPDGAPTPNPNVLFEYCWARESLGYRRIISVMNTAFGNPMHDELPFDLKRLRHPIQFDCPETANEEARRRIRDGLARELKQVIKAIAESEDFKAPLPKSLIKILYPKISS